MMTAEVIPMRDIGKNVRDLRERSGLTQEALAEKLFVTRQTVSNYETGKTRPDLDMLIRIAETLETDANTVLYGIPISPRKRQLLRQFIPAVSVFLALLLAVLILRPMVKAHMARTYLGGLFTLLNFLLIPLLWASGGFFLTNLGKLCLDSHKKLPLWAKRLCIVLLSLWGIALALLLVLCGFHIYGDILAMTRDSVSLHFSRGKILDTVAYGIEMLTFYATPLWLLPGFLLSLVLSQKA